MAEEQIVVTITADITALEAEMQRASAAAMQAMGSVQQSVQGTNSSVGALGTGAKKNIGDAKNATNEWAKAFTPVERAFNTAVTGMVLGTTTWQKAVQRATQSVLSEEINASLRQLEAWILKETGMTAATKTGAATRQASDASSQSSLLGLIAETLAQWLGLETEKTAATTAGNTSRAVSDAAAQAAAAALAVARAFGQIQMDAAVAAAGTMASISAIPYVGPFIAPGMATAAYGETLGWAAGLGAGLFSAAGGLWNVPADTLAMVHKQETIIPAAIAQPMRDFFTGGGGSGGGSYAITIQAIDTQSGAQFLMNNAPLIAKGLAREMRNGNSVFRSAS
jgi:hypothetical protein